MEFCFYCEKVGRLPYSLRKECQKKGVVIHEIPELFENIEQEIAAEPNAIGLLAGKKQILTADLLKYFEKTKIPILVAGNKTALVPVPDDIQTVILFAPHFHDKEEMILEIANRLHGVRNTFGPGELKPADIGFR